MTDMDFTPQTPADTTATPVVDTNIVNDDTTADDTTADNATPTAALWGRLAKLQWLLHRQQSGRRRRRGPLADASRGQGRILAALKMRDDLSTKDLAFLLGMQVSSLNEALGKLAKAGYITREKSPNDGRIMLVRLTDKGHAEEKPETIGTTDIFAALTADEQSALMDYLDRIIATIEDSLGGDESWGKLMAGRARMAQRMGFDPDDMPFGPGFGGPGFGRPGLGGGRGGDRRDRMGFDDLPDRRGGDRRGGGRRGNPGRRGFASTDSER